MAKKHKRRSFKMRVPYGNGISGAYTKTRNGYHDGESHERRGNGSSFNAVTERNKTNSNFLEIIKFNPSQYWNLAFPANSDDRIVIAHIENGNGTIPKADTSARLITFADICSLENADYKPNKDHKFVVKYPIEARSLNSAKGYCEKLNFGNFR